MIVNCKEFYDMVCKIWEELFVIKYWIFDVVEFVLFERGVV